VVPVVDVELLPQGLHTEPERLRKSLQKVIDERAEGYDAVLLSYGLCSNGIQGLTCPHAPLVVPRAHDCITLLLGSRHRYREYFEAHPGTYWYSPGWIEESRQPSGKRCRETLAEYVEKYGEENAPYLMEIEQAWLSNYGRAAFVDWNFDCSEVYRRYTRQCAEELRWECDELVGDPGLLFRMLSGCWNEDEILVVPPGHTITSAFNEDIIAAVPLAPDHEHEDFRDIR
jgi:hypothetical protein